MTLPSGAHVKIGSYEFMLAEELSSDNPTSSFRKPHYKHTYQTLQTGKTTVSGTSVIENLRPEKLVWYVKDWSGGENNRNWQEDDPTVYDFAMGANGRVRGQLTGRPARSALRNKLTADDATARPVLGVGNSAMWYGGGYTLGYIDTNGANSDPFTAGNWNILTTTTTKATDIAGIRSQDTSGRITAMTGDSEYIYYSAWSSGSSGTRVTLAHDASTTNNATLVEAKGTSKAPYAGLAKMGPFLFAWTGRRLFKLDVSQLITPGTTAADSGSNTGLASGYIKKVFDTGVDIASSNVFGTKWWANCLTAENKIIMFYSTYGQAHVYQFKMGTSSVMGGGDEIWTPPLGATIKSMTYSNGILYFAGHWGGDSNSNGHGFLYAMPLDNMTPTPIGFFRHQNNKNLQMQESCASWGNQVMVAAARTGRVFIYDADFDAISMLDALDNQTGGSKQTETNAEGLQTDGPFIPNINGTGTGASNFDFKSEADRIGDMITFGQYRMALVFNPSTGQGPTTTYQLVGWQNDDPNNREAGGNSTAMTSTLESPTWDFDTPFEQKLLFGFDVLFKPLSSGQSFTIEYSKDGNSWVTAGTLTSSDTDASKGRTYISVSSSSGSVKFHRLRYRVTVSGTSAASAKPPIITGIAVEAYLTQYDQTWDLVLRMKNPTSDTRKGPVSDANSSWQKRDWLLTQVANKNIVSFKDGYRYKHPGVFTTHDVYIESPEDDIFRNAEGWMSVTLRAVPT